MSKGKQNDDLLLDDDFENALFGDDEPEMVAVPANDRVGVHLDNVGEEPDYEIPGQLAIDIYETQDQLVVKSRVAGVNARDLDINITDGVLKISGTLSAGDDASATQWHTQECYWGAFERSISLPVPVKEDEVEAVLKDGVLTITFTKVQPKGTTINVIEK